MVQKVAFDARTGELLAGGEAELPAHAVGPLSSLPRNLTAADGTVFVYDSGNTRHLEAMVGDSVRIVKKLDDFPHDLNIVGDLAIFSLAGNDTNLRGGEVVAYDWAAGALRWKFESWRHGAPPLNQLTDIAVDDDRVLVSVDQVVFALDVRTGKPLWKTRLPRQQLRPWNNAWTRFGRVVDRLYVTVYEDLFVLRRSDGQLLLSLDAGEFGAPWPTLWEDRICLATLSGTAELMSTTTGGGESASPPLSLIKVTRTGDRFTLNLVTANDIPAAKKAWSSLHAVPAARKGSDEIVLELLSFQPSFEIRTDLTGLLEDDSEAYVQLTSWISAVVLLQNSDRVAQLEIHSGLL